MTILSIILFILAFGLLITLHELGHFLTAKLFKVYCHEFSIGFGPLLYQNKKNKETKFSIRAFPVGGYVAMAGEENEQFDENIVVPKERTIEGIKKWKKAIVVSTGIVVNAVLALLIFTVSNLCFPITYVTAQVAAPIESLGIEEDDEILYKGYKYEENGEDKILLDFYYEYTESDGLIHAGQFYIVDDDVEFKDKHYVLTYTYYTDKTENLFSEGINLFEGIKAEDFDKETEPRRKELHRLFDNAVNSENPSTYYPNFTHYAYLPDNQTTFVADVNFYGKDPIQITMHGNEKGKYNDIGLKFKLYEDWAFKPRFKGIFEDFKSSSLAVGKGLKTLFSKGGIKNMSGVVGIFTTSRDVLSNYTFARYLYFWGLISVNLAIFNLLPFPGLDGWQLLVTIIEGVSKKKLPKKFKTIMSFVGLAILMVLMVAVLVVDIGRLV